MRPKINNIEEQLREDEGERLTAYKDSEGYLTIGIGVLIDERKGGGITKAESSYLFNNRLNATRDKLKIKFPHFVYLDEVRQGILLNMSYQMGVDGLLAFKKMLAAVEAHNWYEAARQMKDSTWYRQTPNRAERLIKQMQTGEWQ